MWIVLGEKYLAGGSGYDDIHRPVKTPRQNPQVIHFDVLGIGY